MTDQSIEERVLLLHGEAKWQEIINLGTNEEDYEGRRLLWVWPSLNDLHWLKNITDEFCLKGIVSIGCGSGLLEWIIQQYSGCDVVGVETDKSWWSSGYSPPLFLKNTIFVDDEEPRVKAPMTHALFFCYFNNGQVFQDYMRYYEGRVVIIIGPDEGINRTTDPLPFDKKFERLGWSLRNARKLDNGKDIATVYTRQDWIS